MYFKILRAYFVKPSEDKMFDLVVEGAISLPLWLNLLSLSSNHTCFVMTLRKYILQTDFLLVH